MQEYISYTVIVQPAWGDLKEEITIHPGIFPAWMLPEPVINALLQVGLIAQRPADYVDAPLEETPIQSEPEIPVDPAPEEVVVKRTVRRKKGA